MQNEFSLKQAVDELGDLLADRAALDVSIKAVKERIAECGEGNYEGEDFRVTVRQVERSKLNLDAVRRKLSPQFLAAHTTYFSRVDVRCVARNGEEVTS